MNRIVFLKALIVIITLLIFIALGGIGYALINYKRTPKLLSRPAATATATIPEFKLPADQTAVIKDGFACGDLLCLRISQDFKKDRIAVVNPQNLSLKGWISVPEKK